MKDQPGGDPRTDGRAGDPPPPPAPGVLKELTRLGQALKHLFGAQFKLASAEFALARSSISIMLLAGLAATVTGVGFGLSILAVIGVLLARWFGSWLWALLALAVLQVVFLILALKLFRRCMHWMTLPATRGEFKAIMRDSLDRAREEIAEDEERPR